jgi:hypothetical protein
LSVALGSGQDVEVGVEHILLSSGSRAVHDLHVREPDLLSKEVNDRLYAQ